MKNFFDAIGVADMEKVHSAVIGWMLSDECKAFGEGDDGNKARSKLLQQIFHVEPIKSFKSIKSYIEWRNIDILIVTQTVDELQECWIIENKIKSSQHSDQLNRYYDTITYPYLLSSRKYKDICKSRNNGQKEEDIERALVTKQGKKYINKYANNPHHFCFLTLSKETPKCMRKGAEWCNTQYSELYGFLKASLSSRSKSCCKDYIILNEYLGSMEVLTKAVKSFLDGYKNYKKVFEEGHLRKEDKRLSGQGDYADYISENGLETIFQKCFLQTLIQDNSFKHRYKKFTVSETHGTALAEVTIKEVSYSCFNIPCQVRFGIQFQNGSFKLQILGVVPDNDSDKRKKKESIDAQDFIEYWEGVYSDLGIDREWFIHKSNSQIQKVPYLSFTQKRPWWKKEPWYQEDRDVIIDVWNKACDICIGLIDKFIG